MGLGERADYEMESLKSMFGINILCTRVYYVHAEVYGAWGTEAMESLSYMFGHLPI